jgi:hypothetical protein
MDMRRCGGLGAGGALVLVVVVAGCGDESEPRVETQSPEPCEDGAVPFDVAACVVAGVPPECCGEGFAPDGVRGCVAELPEAACPDGQMAIPGELACRPVKACAEGTWGDIPVDATTQHVDPSYAGGGEDGSSERPWTTLAEAVSAAAPGAIVALAAGSYPAGLDVVDRPVRVWGTCPTEVTLSGPGRDHTVVIRGAAGTELRDVAITGAGGVLVSGAEGVVLDRVWIHDTTDKGLEITDDEGATSFAVTGSLFERTKSRAMYVLGARGTISQTEVRDTRARDDGIFGTALEVLGGDLTAVPAEVTVERAVFGQSRDVALLVFGSTVTVDSTLIRDTLPSEASQRFGRAIDVEEDYENGNHAVMTVTRSVFERSHDLAVFVAGSELTLEDSVIRDTAPEGASGHFGRALQVQDRPGLGRRGRASVARTVLERCHDAGLVVTNADATLVDTIVRDVAPRAADGGFGDGVAAWRVEDITDDQAPFATLALDGVRIERSARAGVASFGASVTMRSSLLACHPVLLDGERAGEVDASFEDGGGNRCGCDEQEEPCKVLSSSLAPPEPVE